MFLGVLVSRGAVVAVVHPEHGDVRLHLRDEVEDDGLVRAEVRRDDGASAGLGDGPAHDVESGLAAQVGVGFGDVFGSHGVQGWQAKC